MIILPKLNHREEQKEVAQ